MSFFCFCWKNEKIDWPKCARTVLNSIVDAQSVCRTKKVRYVKMGSVPQTGSGMKTKRKTKKKSKN